MKIIKHFFSESVIWQTVSVFVDSEGNHSNLIGESDVIVSKSEIINRSYAITGEKKVENNYIIHPKTSIHYTYRSDNPDLGIQLGTFDINGNQIFSKFRIDETELNGYEIIRLEGNICYASGALYNGYKLINAWTSEMKKKPER